jgi:hypothetical protein
MAAQGRHVIQHSVSAVSRLDRKHPVISHDDCLTDIEHPQCTQHLDASGNVAKVAAGRPCGRQRTLRRQDLGRDFMRAQDRKSMSLDYARNHGQQTIVAAAKSGQHLRQDPQGSPVRPQLPD